MNNKKILKIKIIFILALFFMPVFSHAAVISVSSLNSVSAKDTTIMEVYLDAEEKTINTLDGEIILQDESGGNFEVKDINLANSVFTMWPRSPSVEDGKKIYFSGGVPGGVKGSRLLLFRFAVKINNEGMFSIRPNNLFAYLNDGIGTSIKIVEGNSVIKIGKQRDVPKDFLSDYISSDNTPPLPFGIEILKDENLFEGRKFAYFETSDEDSGIDRYEVREGNGPSVRTGTSYVLINQNKILDLYVTAYDKAGNFQVAVLNQKKPFNWIGVVIYVVLISLIIKFIKMLILRKRKNA